MDEPIYAMVIRPCGQCGKAFEGRACGPTHVAIFAALRLAAAAPELLAALEQVVAALNEEVLGAPHIPYRRALEAAHMKARAAIEKAKKGDNSGTT